MLAAFTDPVFDSQRNFRELLQAMARPAAPQQLPVLPPAPAPVTPAAMAILLTLCDAATSVWLQQPSDEAVRHLRFHAGLRLAEHPQEADFALISDPATMPLLDRFSSGDLRYPDRSASLILQVAGFRTDSDSRGDRMRFAGPGLREPAVLAIDGLPQEFWRQRAALTSRLPLGIDLFFVAAQQVVALPRTTRLLES